MRPFIPIASETRHDRATEASRKSAEKEEKEDITADEALRRVKRAIRNSAVSIAEGLIAAAKSGQLPLAKYLYELGGIDPQEKEAGACGTEETLIEKLLRRASECGVPPSGESAQTIRSNLLGGNSDTVK